LIPAIIRFEKFRKCHNLRQEKRALAARRRLTFWLLRRIVHLGHNAFVALSRLLALEQFKYTLNV